MILHQFSNGDRSRFCQTENLDHWDKEIKIWCFWYETTDAKTSKYILKKLKGYAFTGVCLSTEWDVYNHLDLARQTTSKTWAEAKPIGVGRQPPLSPWADTLLWTHTSQMTSDCNAFLFRTILDVKYCLM